MLRGILRLVIEYITVDNVENELPRTKNVTTKSSSDSVNAIRNAERIPGINCGKTDLKNAVTGGAPKSCAAS